MKATNDLEEWDQEFASYCTMVASCYDPAHPSYKEGTSVKEEWLQGFQVFLADVGPTPDHKKELETDNKVLAEAEKLLSSDGLSEDYLKRKLEEIQDDVKNGRQPSEEDAVKFTAIFLSSWYMQRSHTDESITLAGALKRFKRGERPQEKVK